VSTTATLLMTAQRLLWGGTLVGCGALALRLSVTGLHRSFPFFFSYLLYRLARGLALYYLPYKTDLYFWAWSMSAPLFWLVHILVVLEIYSKVLRNYPGIASLGRWVLTGALVVAIGVSGLSLSVDFSNAGEQFKWILLITVIERGVMSSLAIFLLMITMFLVWYPVPLSRNVVVHSMVCALFFLGATTSLLVRNVTGHQVTLFVNVALGTIDLACFVMWAVLLSRAGESNVVVLRHYWRAEQQQQLMDQLDAVNATLLRASRKPQQG